MHRALVPFKERRNLLLDKLNNVTFVIAAYQTTQQSNDMAAPFVQEANFYYLTGIEDEGWLLIVEDDGTETLVAPDVSDEHYIFSGGLSSDDARRISGVSRVVSHDDGAALLDELLRHKPSIAALGDDPHAWSYDFSLNGAPIALWARVQSHAKEAIDMRPVLARLRSRKSQAEVDAIKTAVKATVGEFSKVKKGLSEGRFVAAHEYSIEAEFTYGFRRKNLHHAYEPIVAAGKNACTLHYIKNSEALPDNGLILMDIGAKVDGYAADITRTYAVGTPTPRQVSVHAAVERAHHQIINLIRPELSFKEYHAAVDEIMKDALQTIGLLEDRADTTTYRKYFPHAVSHGLGLDVHESMGGYETFQPGMVITVEPGIYIPEEGIGIRIEDDILVTETGRTNLSADLATSL